VTTTQRTAHTMAVVVLCRYAYQCCCCIAGVRCVCVVSGGVQHGVPGSSLGQLVHSPGTRLHQQGGPCMAVLLSHIAQQT